MKAIVACDRNWGIGRDNGLLFHLPGDLKYFKEKTLGKTVIMGRKTLESLPGGRPLPGRETVILSKTMDERDDVKVFREKEDVLEYIKDKDAFVCGGESVYRLFLEDCSSFLVTVIDEEARADKFFPDLDAYGYRISWESEPQEEKGIRYKFREYVR